MHTSRLLVRKKILLSLAMIAGYVLWRYWVATPRLSGAELSSLESQTTLRDNFRLESIDVHDNSGSNPDFSVEKGLWRGETWLPDIEPSIKKKLGQANIQLITKFARQLAAHNISWMAQDEEMTIFTSNDGTRYLRWKNGVPKPSRYSDQIDNSTLVKKADGGWLIYR